MRGGRSGRERDRQARRPRGGIRLAAVLLVLYPVGCLYPFSSELEPRPLEPLERGEQRGPRPEVKGDSGPQVDQVERLSQAFYTRIINRRFNSIATFHDPALRELFASPEAFNDYFAALADALGEANFEALRPTQLSVEQLEALEQDVVLVTVRYRGRNSLPLRFWSVELVQTDRWERAQGRWWIIPGKL